MITVRVGNKGLRDAYKQLQSYEKQKIVELKKEVARASISIEGLAKQNCPVDTGRLRSSISVDYTNDGLNGVVGTNVEYAEKIENGGSRKAPNGFLFPAAEQERARFLANVRAIVKK